MPSYADRNRSLLYALSDFWTQIFADSDTVESVYRGAEVLIGQIYLDLLGDMLNMSVRDTALFRKELFRLIRVREDTVLRAPDGRFRVPLGADVVDLKVLHNKVFAVTAALERGTDFVQVDAEGNVGHGGTGLFEFDPTASQPTLEYGTATSAMRFTGVTPGARVAISLVDDGTSPAQVELHEIRGITIVAVRYDGPNNGGTGTARVLADVLTEDVHVRERLRTECLVVEGPVTAPPETAEDVVPLSFAKAAPLIGFGARTFPATFGTKLTSTRQLRYSTDIEVQKGDILRLEPSARSGGVVEVPISLVREDALYSPFAAMPAGTEDALLERREYSILRTPADHTVIGEAWTPWTVREAYGTVDRSTSTIHVPGLAVDVAWALLTDTVFLAGSRNAGPVTLTSWNPATERFTYFGADIEDEANVPLLRSVSLLGSVSTGGTYSVSPVAGQPGVYDLTGVPGSDTCIGGVLFLTDSLDAASVVPGVKARVIANNGGDLRFTDVQDIAALNAILTNTLLGVAVVTPVSATPERGTRLELDQPQFTGDAPELRTQLLPGSLVVHGRRLIDGKALVQGADWNYVPEAHGVRWVNTPDLRTGVSFDYEVRQILFASSDLAESLVISGALTYVSGTDRRIQFQGSGYDWNLGDRVELEAGSGANTTSLGTYYVEELQGGNVILGGLFAQPVLVDPTGPAFTVVRWPTGTIDIDAPQERISEVALWAPDIQVDRMSLASTYGYLLGRVEPSSEQYRSTLRGLMQLYMLGPTCARLEAAVHVIAGLPVVRDENELLLRYESDVIASGTGLVLDGPSRSARLLTSSFPTAVFEGYLVVTSGYNAGRQFQVETVTSGTELVLQLEPFTDDGAGSGVTWEIVGEPTHAVVTDRNRYVLPLSLPFKSKFTDPTSFGTLRLRAFETFTDAVVVKDETSHPGWWQSARIPSVLWPGQSAARLQSSPSYIPHVFDPIDEACFGDPGLRFGTDDTGVEIPRTVLHEETTDDAFLRQDPHAPFSYDYATFSSDAYATDVSHVGYVIQTTVDGEELELPILGIVDPSTWRVRLPRTLSQGGGRPCPAWKLVIDTAVMRHTTAFVVFDRYLKQHVFTVEIDATLLGEIDTRLLSEIQARLREVKPADSYMLLSPNSSFVDVIAAEDELTRQRILNTSGAGGDDAVATENLLRFDGTWRFGDSFRYDDWTDTITVGTNSPIADSGPGYFADVHNLEWQSGATKGGAPAELTVPYAPVIHTGTARINLADASGGVWIDLLSAPNGLFSSANATLSHIAVLTGSQQGVYRIGRVDAAGRRARVYMPSGYAELSVQVEVRGTKTFSATVRRQSDGSTTISAPVGMLPSTGLFGPDCPLTIEPMTSVGLDGSGISSGLVDPSAPWQLGDFLGLSGSTASFELGFLSDPRTHSVGVVVDVSYPDVLARITLPPTTPLELQFTSDMGRLNRIAANAATAGEVSVGIVFNDGVNAGLRARIERVLSPFEAEVVPWSQSPFAPAAATGTRIYFWHFYAATLPAAPVTLPVRAVYDRQRQVHVPPATDNGFGSLLWQDPTTPVEAYVGDYIDTASVTYAAYARLSPIDLDATPPDPTKGDTPFAFGGLSPSLRGLRRRGQRDFDLTELPIEIARRPALD